MILGALIVLICAVNLSREQRSACLLARDLCSYCDELIRPLDFFSRVEVDQHVIDDDGESREEKDCWTVFLRRHDGKVDFNRDWTDYVKGFGNKSGDFWIGLEKLHRVTSDVRYQLKIELEDWEDNTRHAEYSEFYVGSAEDRYRLKVSGYSGTAGDALVLQNGTAFTTKDSDNDLASYVNCAKEYKGGWWYNNCSSNVTANLNGIRYEDPFPHPDGIVWSTWKGPRYSLKYAEMKFRPAP